MEKRCYKLLAKGWRSGLSLNSLKNGREEGRGVDP